MLYAGDGVYKNREGVVISIHYDGIRNESNWQMITAAVTVESFSGSNAILSAYSPYTSGRLYFRINAANGTLIDGSGDVYYRQ